MKKFPIRLFLTSLFATIFLLVIFKLLRPLFPPATVTSSGIIGYSQYTGYPFYFDNLLFLIFIATPVCFVFITYIWKEKHEKS